MSSACNGLIVLAVARVTSVDTFGAATILFAFAAAAMSAGRGALGTPIMLSAGSTENELRREAGFAATMAILFGLVISLAALVGSFFLGVPSMGGAFVPAIPLVVVLVVFRHTLISVSRPRAAMAWDAVAATGSALLFAATLLRPQLLSGDAMVLLWAVFVLAGALGMALNFQLRPELRGIRNWWREASAARVRYGVEASLGQLKIIIVTSVATGVIGASAAASLRGASTLLSPLAVLLSALPLAVIPEAVRSGTPPRALWRKLLWIGLGGSLLVGATGTVLMLLPDSLGQLILGNSWKHARNVLPIVTCEYAAMVWGSVGLSFLRFQGKSGPLLASTLAFTVVSIILCTAMALITVTAVGVAWGGAISAVVMAVAVAIYARPARG